MKGLVKILNMIYTALLGKDGKLSFAEIVKAVSFFTAIFIVIYTVISGGTIDTATLLILLAAAGVSKALK